MLGGSLKPHCGERALQQALFAALAADPAGRPYQFAGFQRRVFGHILRHYGNPGVSGTIVCAGTGSGKTKAFYVPALLAAATELKERSFPKVIAIYPRNVLLADQLREALSEAEKLRPVLARFGLRPLRFGALLGNTPWKNAFERQQGDRSAAEEWHDWRPVGAVGFRIPFLKSPRRPGEDLVWRNSDRKAGRNCLYRAGGETSDPDVPDGVLALTREDLMADPPDVLFLSAEMLNREMGNPAWARAFGIGQGSRAPRLLLLDEVHSYEGIQGARSPGCFAAGAAGRGPGTCTWWACRQPSSRRRAIWAWSRAFPRNGFRSSSPQWTNSRTRAWSTTWP